MAITTPNIDFEFVGRVDAAQDYAFCPEMYCGTPEACAAYTRGFRKVRPSNAYALAYERDNVSEWNRQGVDYTPPSVQ